jgi:hypothetical protein
MHKHIVKDIAMGKGRSKRSKRHTARHKHKAQTQRDKWCRSPTLSQSTSFGHEHRHRITVADGRPVNGRAAGQTASNNVSCRGFAPVTWEWPSATLPQASSVAAAVDVSRLQPLVC